MSCLLFSCDDESSNKIADDYKFLDDFPQKLPDIEYPEDNFPSEERIELGRLLFNEKRLSRTNEISCASCHKAEHAFSDITPTSKGVDGIDGTRNSVSLMNVAYQENLLREGSVPTLEMQILVPFQEHNEFDLNILDAVEKLKDDSIYSMLSQEAYGRDFDSYVISRAISAYERTLIGGNSKFDAYLKDEAKLTDSEIRGMKLFFSDSLACSSCHSGVLFTSQGFANNGLYEQYEDLGRGRLTHLDSDIGVFKIPSLRNVSLTPPYMFDGSLNSLEDVINHYSKGGMKHPNKDKRINSFVLTKQERNDIIRFLITLDEEAIIH